MRVLLRILKFRVLKDPNYLINNNKNLKNKQSLRNEFCSTPLF